MCERGDIQVLKLPRSDGSLEPVGVDSCIEPIVRALNDAGLRTVASCCGHGIRPGTVALADGREVLILPDFETARSVDPLWPPLALPALRSAPIGEGEACSHLFDVAKCIYCGAPSPRAAAPVPAREGEPDLLEAAMQGVLVAESLEGLYDRLKMSAKDRKAFGAELAEIMAELGPVRAAIDAARLRSEGGGE